VALSQRARARSPLLRFSVRTALVCVTLACLWLGWRSNRARHQYMALREIQSLGGRVQFAPSWPTFVHDVVHRVLAKEHLCCDVVAVDLRNCNFASHHLAHLRGFPLLESLYLDRSNVTDDAIAQIAGSPRLTTLSVSSTEVTDAGLEHLLNFPRLSTLDIAYTRVSRSAADNLKQSLPGCTIFLDRGGHDKRMRTADAKF
jgi:hypothetical protein